MSPVILLVAPFPDLANVILDVFLKFAVVGIIGGVVYN